MNKKVGMLAAQVQSMDDNCGEWVECMGVASGCGEQEVGVASGSGWNLWVWLLGVVLRRYIDFLILLIPTPLVSVLFCSSIPTFLFIFLMFIYYYQRGRSRGCKCTPTFFLPEMTTSCLQQFLCILKFTGQMEISNCLPPPTFLVPATPLIMGLMHIKIMNVTCTCT